MQQMLETILPWVYLWPTLLVVSLFFLVGLMCVNLLLGAAVIGLYHVLPENLIDQWIQWILQSFRQKFDGHVSQMEDHLQKTFPVFGQENLAETSLLLWHPHSLMTVTSVIHNTFKIVDLRTKIAAHSVFWWIPIVKDLFRNAHAIPAEYEQIKQNLENGQSIIVMPGGVKEILEDTPPKTVRATILKRKGVFRLALITGKPLVPVISYGENELFPSIRNPFNEFLYGWFRIAIPITSWTAIGNWFKLWNGPIDQIPTHIGKPIFPVKMVPTDQDIEAFKLKYVEALKELFESTKPEGYSLLLE